MIYADNAATTQLDKNALEAMKPFLLEEYGNASQPYFFALKAKKALRESRNVISECIGAKPEEIYFTSGGTESDNWAIKSTALFSKKNSNIITSEFEHHAVLNSCKSLEQLGYRIKYLTPSTDGYISTKSLEKATLDNTCLVSVMLANNELGTIQPISELAKIAHNYGIIFHTDAVQAVGHIPINVKELGVDMLSASAHKFNGPKGIGFLYIKNGVGIHPYINGGYQEQGLRAGTENIASIVGMAVALKNNCDLIEQNEKYINSLTKVLIKKINTFKIDYKINGGSEKLPGILNISFPEHDGESILHLMDLKGICISTGSACDSVNTEISHVLKSIKLDENYAKGTIRISIGKNNTEKEIVQIVEALRKCIL